MNGGAVPKCTSWRGHKFEGRYSKTPPSSESVGDFRGVVAAYLDLVEAHTITTYERDICIRCGFTIERKPTT